MMSSKARPGILRGVLLLVVFCAIAAAFMIMPALADAATHTIAKAVSVDIAIPGNITDGDTIVVTGAALETDDPGTLNSGDWKLLRDIPVSFDLVLKTPNDTIPDMAFVQCATLTGVSLPVATDIGLAALGSCTSLTSVSLPAVTDIGFGAFGDCTSLTGISLPMAESIGDYAFSNCTSLTDVYLPVAESIGTKTFNLCTSLASIYLPEVTNIEGGSWAFEDCTNLRSVYLPKAISIDAHAFKGCINLTDISLPLLTYEKGLFEGCTSLASVSMPEVEGMGPHSFAGCSNLRLMIVKAESPVALLGGEFIDVSDDVLFISTQASSGDIFVNLHGPTGLPDGHKILTLTSAQIDALSSVQGYLISVDLGPVTLNGDLGSSIGDIKWYRDGLYDATLGSAATCVVSENGHYQMEFTYDGGTYRLPANFVVIGSMPPDFVSTDKAIESANADPILAGSVVLSLPSSSDVFTLEDEIISGIEESDITELKIVESISVDSFIVRPTSAVTQSLTDGTAVLAPSVQMKVPTEYGNVFPLSYTVLASAIADDLPDGWASMSVADRASYLDMGGDFELAFAYEYLNANGTTKAIEPVIGPGADTSWTEAVNASVVTFTATGDITLNYIAAAGKGTPFAVGKFLVIPDGQPNPGYITDPVWLTRTKATHHSGGGVGCSTGAGVIALLVLGVTSIRFRRPGISRRVLLFAALCGVAAVLMLLPSLADAATHSIGKTTGTAIIIPTVASGDTIVVTGAALETDDPATPNSGDWKLLRDIPVSFDLVLETTNDTIPELAFAQCSNLTSVSLPLAVNIGAAAFGACGGLTDVSLPVAESIGALAFIDCSSLTVVSLPKATGIGGSAFKDCGGLTDVSMPVAANIEFAAFQQCTSLSGVFLPEAVSIGGWAFAYCSSLSDVSLPKATSIGSAVFRDCSSLSDVSLPVAASIGEEAFRDCSRLTGVSLSKVASIGAYAFRACRSLTGISLPKAASIGAEAFLSCTSLNGVSLPAAVSIGDWAFGWCANLTSVSLPKVASIGGLAFNGCSNLRLIIVKAESPVVLSDDIFDDISDDILIISTKETSADIFTNPDGAKLPDGHKTLTLTAAQIDALSCVQGYLVFVEQRPVTLNGDLGGSVSDIKWYRDGLYDATLGSEATCVVDEDGLYQMEFTYDGGTYRLPDNLVVIAKWAGLVSTDKAIETVNADPIMAGRVEISLPSSSDVLALEDEIISGIEESDVTDLKIVQSISADSFIARPTSAVASSLADGAAVLVPSVQMKVSTEYGNVFPLSYAVLASALTDDLPDNWAAMSVADKASYLDSGANGIDLAFSYEYLNANGTTKAIEPVIGPGADISWANAANSGVVTFTPTGDITLNYIAAAGKGSPFVAGKFLVIPDGQPNPGYITDPVWLTRTKAGTHHSSGGVGCSTGAGVIAILALGVVLIRKRGV